MNNLCHSSVSGDNARKIMTCTFDTKSQSSLLAYWTHSSIEPQKDAVRIVDSRELRNSDGDLINVRQIELSHDTNVVFAIGGSFDKINRGVLTALSFDGWFDEIACFSETFGDAPDPALGKNSLTGFSSIQRVGGIDLLLVSGHQSINLMFFELTQKNGCVSGQFCKIRSIHIDQIHPPVFGLSCQRNEVLALSDSGEKLLQLTFEHDLNKISTT